MYDNSMYHKKNNSKDGFNIVSLFHTIYNINIYIYIYAQYKSTDLVLNQTPITSILRNSFKIHRIKDDK